MDNYRLHIKVGVHEFNGDGPEESVRRDFEEWKALIGSIPAQAPPQQTSQHIPQTTHRYTALPPANGSDELLAIDDEQIDRLFIVDSKQKLVSLRMHPRTPDRNRDAILLILFGYKMKLDTEDVTPVQIKQAMRQTGIKIDRVDKAVARYVNEGYFNKGGIGKGGRYSLTNSGMMRAYEILSQGMQL